MGTLNLVPSINDINTASMPLGLGLVDLRKPQNSDDERFRLRLTGVNKLNASYTPYSLLMMLSRKNCGKLSRPVEKIFPAIASNRHRCGRII
jgi:hypothetical protein